MVEQWRWEVGGRSDRLGDVMMGESKMEECRKGEHVVVTDNCGQSFLGLVKSVNYSLGRLLLSDVVQLPERKIITGYRNFDKNEITEIKKHDDGAVEVVEEEQDEKPENQLVEPDLNKLKNFQSEYCYIGEDGANFQSAIALLKSCSKVGLYAKGTSKGRCGRASVVAISTPSKGFIFDFQTLGDDVLSKGLKEVLESSTMTKVVYDCRLLSDCLKHKHLINLEGVRDVEAEDIMLVYQEREMIRKHNRPLEYLIKVHLGLEVDALDDFADIWNHRPLPPNHLQALVSLASFLVPLQEAIQHKFLQRLLDASRIYNTHVRSLDFFEFLHDQASRTLRKEMIKLVACQNRIRATCRS